MWCRIPALCCRRLRIDPIDGHAEIPQQLLDRRIIALGGIDHVSLRVAELWSFGACGRVVARQHTAANLANDIGMLQLEQVTPVIYRESEPVSDITMR